MTENNYTYSGILKTLKYWFEIKKGDLEKANGGIGIVPYVYDDAFLYWRGIWEAREKNKGTFESQKSTIIGMIENAEYSVILATDKGAAIVGNKYDTMVTLSCLFNRLMENNLLNEQEIIECLKGAKLAKKLPNDILNLF